MADVLEWPTAAHHAQSREARWLQRRAEFVARGCSEMTPVQLASPGAAASFHCDWDAVDRAMAATLTATAALHAAVRGEQGRDALDLVLQQVPAAHWAVPIARRLAAAHATTRGAVGSGAGLGGAGSLSLGGGGGGHWGGSSSSSSRGIADWHYQQDAQRLEDAQRHNAQLVSLQDTQQPPPPLLLGDGTPRAASAAAPTTHAARLSRQGLGWQQPEGAWGQASWRGLYF